MSEIDAARILTRSEIEVIPDGEYLSNKHRDLFIGIRDMKLSKIRGFQDAKAAGTVPEDVCVGINGVLTADVAICDVLIATDFDDKANVNVALELIKGIVKHSPQPSNQKEYAQSLTDNEASMELMYSKTIEDIQNLIRG